MKIALLATCATSLLMSAHAWAGALPKREPLYELVQDFNKDGQADRAAIILVGPGRTDFGELTKERYGLSDGEAVELAIYLGGGNKPFDMGLKPTVTLRSFPDTDRLRWILPLEANIEGSLIYTAASGWGATNMNAESLFVSYRKGEFVVSGYSQAWEFRDNDGLCDVNFLTGKAQVRRGGIDAPAKRVKGKFKLVRLSDWTEAKRPETCDKAMDIR